MEGGKWARGDGKEMWKPRGMGFRDRRMGMKEAEDTPSWASPQPAKGLLTPLLQGPQPPSEPRGGSD